MNDTIFEKVYKVIKERMSVDQLILYYVYRKKTRSSTIEEIAEKLDVPRSTAVEHLRGLKKDGFLKEEKEGKIKQYFPVPQIASQFFDALAQLSSAYITALDHIRNSELKDIKEAVKNKEE